MLLVPVRPVVFSFPFTSSFLCKERSPILHQPLWGFRSDSRGEAQNSNLQLLVLEQWKQQFPIPLMWLPGWDSFCQESDTLQLWAAMWYLSRLFAVCFQTDGCLQLAEHLQTIGIGPCHFSICQGLVFISAPLPAAGGERKHLDGSYASPSRYSSIIPRHLLCPIGLLMWGP